MATHGVRLLASIVFVVGAGAAQVLADSDLSLAATASPDPVAAGSLLSFTMSVSNHGPDVASGTVVELTLPAGLYLSRGGSLLFADGFESGDLSAWSLVAAGPSGCTQVGAEIRCSLGNLANGATETLTLGVTVPGGFSGNTVATASVSSAVVDSDPSNNTVVISTTLVRRADVTLVASTAPDPVLPGAVLTTEWTVSNLGPSTATVVELESSLPPDLLFLSISPRVGHCVGGQSWHCDLGSLQAGTTTTVEVRAVVAASAFAAITQSASALALETDLELSNNVATVVTTVLGARRLPGFVFPRER